jgi:glutaconate CoA-transferase, subunit B
LPLSIGDGELCTTALTTVSVPEFFRYWLPGGRVTAGFLGAAQIDRFANLNTTVIGEYAHPTVRLPGGGGAPEMAAHCREIFIVLPQSRRTFVERLDFTTTIGHGADGQHRLRLAAARRSANARAIPNGPTKVISDLCVLEPDSQHHELVVTSLHPGVTQQQVRDATGWAIRFADTLTETEPPTDSELETLRDLHERTARAHGTSKSVLAS